MTMTKGTFASGALPATKSPLYVVPAATTGSLRVRLVNKGSGTITCKLYVNSSGTSRLIDPNGLELQKRHARTTDYEELSAGDKIEGEASIADVVDYRIKGHTRS